MNRIWLCLALLAAAPIRVHAQGARTVAFSVSAGAHASYPEQLSASLVVRGSGTSGIGFGVRVSGEAITYRVANVTTGSSAEPALTSFLVTGVLGGRFDF